MWTNVCILIVALYLVADVFVPVESEETCSALFSPKTTCKDTECCTKMGRMFAKCDPRGALNKPCGCGCQKGLECKAKKCVSPPTPATTAGPNEDTTHENTTPDDATPDDVTPDDPSYTTPDN